MPFNGSGTFVSIPAPDFPALPGTTILASSFNANMNDIFTNGLTKCLTRDGQSPPTANLPMAGFKFTGIGNGTADSDSASLGQTMALRGQVGAVDWDTRVSTGIFEATAASLTGPAANFPPTTSLGMLYVTAQGALIDQLYVTSGLIYNRQKVGGTFSAWAFLSQINPNFIINACFDFWDYATSQVTSTYGSDNRWFNQNVGSTKTHSRQNHTLGTVLGVTVPVFFSRTVVVSVAGAANAVLKTQRIERVATLQGQNCTVSFWAKASSSLPIAVNIGQNFGTGGAPSASVSVNGQKVTLTTSFAFYSLTFAVPSITGKTLGTVGDYLELAFWFDAGANFNAQTNTLGQQSGTFDLFGIKLEAGQVATPLLPKNLADERIECQRFYSLVNASVRSYNHTAVSATYASQVPWPVAMRATPTALGLSAGLTINVSTTLLSTPDANGGWFEATTPVASGPVQATGYVYSLSAEL